MLAADERLVGLHDVVWIKLSRFSEEFGQTRFALKLHFNAVILIPQIGGETSNSVFNVFLV
jgi:hypothetical protein